MTAESQEPHPHHPGRDSKGRWLKGYCGNLNGRPEKKPRLDMSNPVFFGNTLIDVTRNGETVQITRHEALLNKAFEDAMKGSVSQQRYLLKEIREAIEARAQLFESLLGLVDKYEENPQLFSDADMKKLHRIIQQVDLSDYESPELKRKKRRRQNSGRNSDGP